MQIFRLIASNAVKMDGSVTYCWLTCRRWWILVGSLVTSRRGWTGLVNWREKSLESISQYTLKSLMNWRYVRIFRKSKQEKEVPPPMGKTKHQVFLLPLRWHGLRIFGQKAQPFYFSLSIKRRKVFLSHEFSPMTVRLGVTQRTPRFFY